MGAVMFRILIWLVLVQRSLMVAAGEPPDAERSESSKYFEQKGRVIFRLDGPWPAFAVSADGTRLYFMDGTTLKSVSLSSGEQETLVEAKVWGSNINLAAIPNDPTRLLVAWQCGDAKSPFAVGILDIRDGSFRMLPVGLGRSVAAAGGGPPAREVAGVNLSSRAADVVECNSDGRLFVSPSGSFVVLAAATRFPCPAAKYVIVSLVSGAEEHQISAPTRVGPTASERPGHEQDINDCPEVMDFAWSRGDLLHVYKGELATMGRSYVMERSEAGHWASSTPAVTEAEQPVHPRIRSKSAWNESSPLRLLQGPLGGPVTSDPQPYFAGLPATGDRDPGWVEAVTSMRDVVLLWAQPRRGGGYDVAAVALQWKDRLSRR